MGSNDTSKSRKDSVRLKLALIVFGLGIGLLIAEITLRLYNPFGFRMRGNTIVLPVNKRYLIEDPNLDKFDKLDKRVIHTKNSLGFRGPEPPADFKRHLTLLAVGGSTTECFYLSDDQTWPARVETQLLPKFPKLWLNNAGLDGHSTFGHLALVRDYISKLRPNIVLFLIGINDLFADGPQTLDHLDRHPLAGSIANHSELFALALNFLRYHRTSALTSLGAMPKPLNLHDLKYSDFAAADEQHILQGQERFLPEYESRLVSLIDLTRHSGIEPILITQPALFGETVDDVTGTDLGRVSIEIYRKMNGRTAWNLLEKYNDVTRKVGHEYGVAVIDLARKMPKTSKYFYDYIHYGKDGAAEVANIIADNLCPILTAKGYAQTGARCNERSR
jgi:lysophospholipase L1-like esterase